MKRQVVLFFPDTGERKNYFPPLALMALAAPLETAGYAVTIVDARVHPDYRERLRALLPGALAVGISSLTGSQIKNGIETSRFIREISPTTPIVWGGWHPSILPEQTCADPRVNYVVVGQGEITFQELLRHLQTGKPELASINGLVFKRDGKVIANPCRALTPLEQFPMPAFHLVDFPKLYPGRKNHPTDIFTIYRTSIGCPWRCGFCADPIVYKRKYLMLPVDRVIEDLRTLHGKYGVTDILFVDDTLLINEKRAREVATKMLESKLGIRWQATVRTGTICAISEETWRLVKESGCTLLHPGVEASNQAMLDYIEKDEKDEHTYRSAELVAKVGIPALFSYIVCFPGEPPDSIASTFRAVRRLKEINPDNVMPVNFYTPYPGNKLFDLSVEHGFVAPQSLEEWAEFNTRFGNVPWITPAQRDEVMKKDKFYFPAAYPSETMQRKMQAGRHRFTYRLLHRISRWRVEHDYWGFALDWWLLLRYWKFWEKNVKRFGLHDLNFR